MKNLKEEESKQKITGKYRDYMVMYLDIIIRSLIVFLFTSIVIFLVLGKLVQNKVYLFLIIFFIVIAISPLFSRIKLGDRIITAFDDWLDNFITIPENEKNQKD